MALVTKRALNRVRSTGCMWWPWWQSVCWMPSLPCPIPFLL